MLPLPSIPLYSAIKAGTRIFSNEEGHILHISKRAINLLFGNKVITLINREGIVSPSTIIVDVEKFPEISSAKFIDDYLVSDKFQVHLQNFVNLEIHEYTKSPPYRFLDIIHPFILPKPQSISNALCRYLDYSYEPLLTQVERQVFKRQLKILVESVSIEDLLSKLLGLGFGLTPSGDDFAMGVISIFNFFQVNTDFLRRIINAYDYAFSRTILQNCLDGFYIQPVFEFGNALMNNAVNSTHIQNILRFGHQSGLDTLSGMYFALLLLSCQGNAPKNDSISWDCHKKWDVPAINPILLNYDKRPGGIE